MNLEISFTEKFYFFQRSDFEWAHLLAAFHVKDTFDLWDGIYELLIIERAKDLITIHYKEVFKGIIDCISDALLEDEEKYASLVYILYV